MTVDVLLMLSIILFICIVTTEIVPAVLTLIITHLALTLCQAIRRLREFGKSLSGDG